MVTRLLRVVYHHDYKIDVLTSLEYALHGVSTLVKVWRGGGGGGGGGGRGRCENCSN